MGLKFVQVESIWSRYKFNYADFISFLINYKWPLSYFPNYFPRHVEYSAFMYS